MSLSLESGTSYAPMPGGAPDGQGATSVVSINSYDKFVTPSLRRDAKFRSGIIIYREKAKLYEPLDQVLRSHSCKIRTM